MMVLHDKEFTFAMSRLDALTMARRYHSGARRVEVETIEKAVINSKWPKPGKYIIHSYY